MTTLKPTLARAARWSVVATTSALTTLAIGLPIALAGPRGGEAGPIPVPRNPLAYFALLILAPVFISFAVSAWLATRLGLMNYSGGSMLLLQILVILTSIPVLAWLGQLADVVPA
ncbi:hypothetical protein [Paludisphaera soli]|uniref:hypothetical protein n=1 Tax=Paludisphaera soli TaxID=2712865 RepID=UPI0013EAA6B3|nr:hypothetical protein [Paludisphaera soli]